MIYDDKDIPLVLNPGETKEIDFMLLSSARESNKKISIDVSEGKEIASLEKKEFDLPSNGEVKGFIKIKVPSFKEKAGLSFFDNLICFFSEKLNIENNKCSSENVNQYLVTLLISDITPSENSGTVGFSFSSRTSFIVKIKEPEKLPESKNNSYLLFFVILIVIILLLIIIIFIILKRRKIFFKGKKSKKR